MKEIVSKISTEDLTRKLIEESVNVNGLNLFYENHREAFREALKTRPNILLKIDGENENKLFSFALKENYKYLIYLSPKKYSSSLIQKYLESRFAAEKDEVTETYFNVNTQKSIDDKLLFSYSCVTPSEDELYYYDSELQIPISLKSEIKAVLKLVRPLSLVNHLDLAIAQVGFNTIKFLIHNEISTLYKSKLSAFIKDNNIGYYSLSASTEDFENEFKLDLNEKLRNYGFEVKDFSVNKISIPQASRLLLEDQAFRIRQRKEEFNIESEFAKISLENYEHKLSIQQKYPDAEHSLTEYEKDLALKRFLIKEGKWEESQLDRTNYIKQSIEDKDKELQKKEDYVPTNKTPEPTKSSFGGLLAFFICIAAAIMPFNLVAGILTLAGVILIFTIIAIVKEKRKAKIIYVADKKTPTPPRPQTIDYDQPIDLGQPAVPSEEKDEGKNTENSELE